MDDTREGNCCERGCYITPATEIRLSPEKVAEFKEGLLLEPEKLETLVKGHACDDFPNASHENLTSVYPASPEDFTSVYPASRKDLIAERTLLVAMILIYYPLEEHGQNS